MTPLRTAWVTRKMAEQIRNCIPVEDACDIVGVTKDRHYAWIREGNAAEKAADAPPPSQAIRDLKKLADEEVVSQREYMVELRKARADGKALLLKKIRDAGIKDWRALAWVGEKVYQELSPMLRQEVTGRDGMPLEVTVRSESDAKAAFERAFGTAGALGLGASHPTDDPDGNTSG